MDRVDLLQLPVGRDELIEMPEPKGWDKEVLDFLNPKQDAQSVDNLTDTETYLRWYEQGTGLYKSGMGGYVAGVHSRDAESDIILH